MPEQIEKTNMWNILPDEYFTATDGEKVEGPMSGVKEQIYPGLGLITIQHGKRLFEIKGNGVAEVVKKKK